MKKLVIVLIICFALIPPVNAITPFIAKCDDSGAVTIRSNQNINCQIYASKDRKEWFHVPGEWNKDLTIFSSEDMVLNDKFSYGLKIVYPGFNYMFDTYCPGYKFSCKELNISINSCYKRAGVFSADFNSVNHNGIYDLKYIFETGKGNLIVHESLMHSKETENMTIGYLGDNHYFLNLKTKFNITKFSITHDKCSNKDNKYYKYVEMQCNKSSCIANRECNANEYCDNDFLCKFVECNICEKISEHKCVPKCNDNKPCTKDECSEGKCRFTAIDGCELNDSCIPPGYARIVNNIPCFCNSSNEWVLQKKDNESCIYDYECLNNCANNICVKQKGETKSIIQRIIDFFTSLFDF